MATFLLREAKDLEAALEHLGRSKVPIPLALRMVAARRLVAERIAETDEVRVGLIRGLTDGERTITSKHDRFPEFLEQFDELMDRSFEVGDAFVLYHRKHEGADEFAWTESFKTVLKEMELNILFSMGGLLEVRDMTAKPLEVVDVDGAA